MLRRTISHWPKGPHLPEAVSDTERCASTDWMDSGPESASQTRTTPVAIVLTGSFFHQNHDLVFHTQNIFHVSFICLLAHLTN